METQAHMKLINTELLWFKVPGWGWVAACQDPPLPEGFLEPHLQARGPTLSLSDNNYEETDAKRRKTLFRAQGCVARAGTPQGEVGRGGALQRDEEVGRTASRVVLTECESAGIAAGAVGGG